MIWIEFVDEAAHNHEAAMKKYDSVLEKHREAKKKHADELRALQEQAAKDDLPPKTRTKLVKKIRDLTAKAPKSAASRQFGSA